MNSHGTLAVYLAAASLLGVVYAFLPITFYNEVFTEPVLMLRGFVPYRDFIQHHAPGLRYALMPLYAFFPGEGAKYYLCVVGVPLLTACCQYNFAKRRFGKRAALGALSIYLVAQPLFNGWLFWLDGCTGVLALAGAALLPEVGSPASRRRLFAIGIALGAGLIIKQTFAVFVLLFCGSSLRGTQQAPWLFIGLGLLPLSTVLLAWTSSSTAAMFEQTVVYNLAFRNRGAFNYAALHGDEALAVVGFLALSLNSFVGQKPEREVAAWALVSLIPLFPRFGWEHFQQALPFTTLLLALQACRLARRRALLLLPFMAVLVLRADRVRGELAFRGFAETYHRRPELESLRAAIAATTATDERIYIWGSDLLPAYALAERLPAARDLYPFPWMFDAERCIGDLESTFRAQRKLVVFLGDDSWEKVEAVRTYLTTNYEISGEPGALRLARRKH
jgi:hypothetical protein